jgi:NADPH:quinone reductase-like Zn-dependent oxidoreductase
MITGRELRSTLDGDGSLRLTLDDVILEAPAADEVILRVEATPINPSDMLLIKGPASVDTARRGGTAGRPTLTLDMPKAALAAMQGRIGESLTVGNEGAGTVVVAGSNVKALEGRRVATFAGTMCADYRKLKAEQVVLLPDGATAADGAAMFVNPLTALGIAHTAISEGHRGIIHTAAASALGQMLQRICIKDGIPLVNVVRSQQQVDLLRSIGARHVVNSTDETFHAQLDAAVSETGATIAFDPIGGGTLGSALMAAMERASISRMTDFSRYGSNEFKQLYLYGGLDPSPIVLNRLAFGISWSVGSWFLTTFLQKTGPDVAARLRQRVLDELTSTFATHYTRTIGLAEMLDPAVMRQYGRAATGEKYLVNPTLN